MAVVDQRPADREQPKRRQMIVRNAAADGGMRDIDQEDTHGFSVRTRVSVAAAQQRSRRPLAVEKPQAALGTGSAGSVTFGTAPKRRSRR